MKNGIFESRSLVVFAAVVCAISLLFVPLVFNVEASPASSYYYKLAVNREGFTTVEINFTSTDTTGESWVFVPKDLSSWNHTETGGRIVQSDIVETNEVQGVDQSYYFYRAFKFRYQSEGLFNMIVKFDFDNGALIIEPRGIFYSPQIGFKPDSTATVEVLFNPSLIVNQKHAIATGATNNYPASEVDANRALFYLQENVVRIQIELTIQFATPDYTTLRSSDNRTFAFKTVTRYVPYARNVLQLYDGIYSNFTRLFNATLDNVIVQFFLPDFNTLLAVGGYVPFTGEQLGEININIVFIRGVNGTVEIIAAHELVHRFLGKVGISPGTFLWFHEGMAQYLSVTTVVNLGYEGAKQEKDNLENGSARLIQQLGGEDFSALSLQYWSPYYQPQNVDISALYLASYYVVSRLPQKAQLSGLDYYSRFFRRINGITVNNIDLLALYLSMATSTSAAVSLQNWGFSVANLYESPVSDIAQEASVAVDEVNPVFQPYKFFAEYVYQQALGSSERGDWERAKSLFQLSITLANLAPLLTFLTIVVVLVVVVMVLSRRQERPKPAVPVPPPEIFQPPS